MTNVDLVGRPERTLVGHVLQQALVDLIDVSLVAKQVHWNGRAATTAATSQILAGRPDGMPAGPVADSHAIEIIHGVLTQAIEGLAEAIDVTGRADPVSQDLLIGVSAGLEKHRWMLEASR